MDYTVKVYNNSQKFVYQAAKSSNLLELLRLHNYEINSFCNKQGTCGKCKVRLTEKYTGQPTVQELKLLGTNAIRKGERLACMVSVESDIEVYLDTNVLQAKIITFGNQVNIELSPDISKMYVELSKPSLNDQRSDAKRLNDELSLSCKTYPLHILKQLPDILRNNAFNITVVINDGSIIGIEPGDTTKCLYGIAFDIGTTTIAAYLMDLHTGICLSTYSLLNPQKKYGADVISRIKHTMDNHSGLNDMQSMLVSAINQSVDILTCMIGIKTSDIYKIVLTGNTTMMHFLLAINTQNLALAPFIPAIDDSFKISTKDLEVNINKNGVALVLPSVSAYVGADTLCAIIASGMHTSKSVSLLIDFGTNGEIVLGNSEWLLACSTAAGPAFEAANIRCGIGGVSGAIDSFEINKNINYTTIYDQKAIGICGTGLLDIISELYRTGVLDETGRFCNKDDLKDLNETLTGRLTTIDAQPAFVIVNAYQTLLNEDIVITQKDVRELQNAKAAIAAGIQVLIAKARLNTQDVSKVYLAGGFGSLINPKSALNIGLLPKELEDRIEPIGNAAGMGAQMSLLSSQALISVDRIKKNLKYIELSSDKSFSDFYIDSMLFP